ncbi:MAG: dihydroorotate dehydrogenase electron transfer subunit [Firmicutes bacterium]|nr:dihydroorotate dehydrogenase electron transfer subunit [Bacillota bacterium]
MPKKISMEIIEQENVGSNVYRLTLAGKFSAQPGQFVQVAVSTAYDPFLKRPFSVHDCSANTLTLLYRRSGRGTSLLAEKKAGEKLEVVGPLGTGFPMVTEDKIILVAGGIGSAPLFYLLKTLQAAGKKVAFYYGARSKNELILREQYQMLADEYMEATDDGSCGHQGVVTELMADVLDEEKPVIFACGPDGMLRAVAKLAKRNKCRCYVSLEAHMACGVGACLGCVVPNIRGEYVRVCVEGPVFPAVEVF